jgi:hypothetical protein
MTRIHYFISIMFYLESIHSKTNLNICVRQTRTQKMIISIFSNFMSCRIIQSLFVNTKQLMNTTRHTTRSSINICLKNITKESTNEIFFKNNCFDITNDAWMFWLWRIICYTMNLFENENNFRCKSWSKSRLLVRLAIILIYSS